MRPLFMLVLVVAIAGCGSQDVSSQSDDSSLQERTFHNELTELQAHTRDELLTDIGITGPNLHELVQKFVGDETADFSELFGLCDCYRKTDKETIYYFTVPLSPNDDGSDSQVYFVVQDGTITEASHITLLR